MTIALNFEPMEVTPPRKITYTHYLGLPAIRYQGEGAHDVVGQIVDVVRKDGTKGRALLTELVWTGVDSHNYPGHDASFAPVALYRFQAKKWTGA